MQSRGYTVDVTTEIRADIERCFDLARSVDMHVQSTKQTNEVAIAGRTSGLLELGESVTWRARHFFVVQELTAKITQLERPRHFRDEMIKGSFAEMAHDHFFEMREGVTLMRDVFFFRAPLGPLGTLAEQLFLGRYMRKFLITRSEAIRLSAETHT
jgi:ligand-binding SRPBCC domain-containing protein